MLHVEALDVGTPDQPRVGWIRAQVDRLADGVGVGNLSINHFVASSAETPFGGVKEVATAVKAAPKGSSATPWSRTSGT